MIESNSELENYRKDAIIAAKDLTYSQDTIYKLERATSINQIVNVMKTARLNLSDHDHNRKNNKQSNEN